MKEYEIEPQPGLPEPLPQGEQILWQGAPVWQSLLRHALHVNVLAAYFAALIVWRFADGYLGGMTLSQALSHAAPFVLVAAIPIAIVVAYAWIVAKTTMYTITNRRVVLRFGIALPIVLNVPFNKIASAAVAGHADGTGDIPLAPVTGQVDGPRVSYLLVWPHIRPWKLSNAEPMLRAIPEPQRVARILAGALATATEQSPVPIRNQMAAIAPAANSGLLGAAVTT